MTRRLSAEPRNPEIRIQLGRKRQERHQREQALALFREAAALDPDGKIMMKNDAGIRVSCKETAEYQILRTPLVTFGVIEWRPMLEYIKTHPGGPYFREACLDINRGLTLDENDDRFLLNEMMDRIPPDPAVVGILVRRRDTGFGGQVIKELLEKIRAYAGGTVKRLQEFPPGAAAQNQAEIDMKANDLAAAEKAYGPGFIKATPEAGSPSSIPGQAQSVTLIPDLTIGVEDGDENLMFGDITRVDLDGKGNIYILDYKFRKIVVCGPDGRHLRTIKVPAGQGPQEATNLNGIAVTPAGMLFINDMRKVIVYGPDGQYLRTFLLDFMVSSIGCPGTEDLVAIGPNGGKILHVFDPTGKPLASFGDLFAPPADLEPMKEMPMIGAPILFNCAKDGRMFVLNPHKYEVLVYKDRKLVQILEGRNEAFNPIRKMGRALLSTAAHIVPSGDLVFVVFQDPDPKTKMKADVFRAEKQIGAIDMPGTPRICDPQGRVYITEEEEFPKVVRCSVIR